MRRLVIVFMLLGMYVISSIQAQDNVDAVPTPDISNIVFPPMPSLPQFGDEDGPDELDPEFSKELLDLVRDDMQQILELSTRETIIEKQLELQEEYQRAKEASDSGILPDDDEGEPISKSRKMLREAMRNLPDPQDIQLAPEPSRVVKQPEFTGGGYIEFGPESAVAKVTEDLKAEISASVEKVAETSASVVKQVEAAAEKVSEMREELEKTVTEAVAVQVDDVPVPVTHIVAQTDTASSGTSLPFLAVLIVLISLLGGIMFYLVKR